MEHRKAIKDGSVTRHWQGLKAHKREAERLEEREEKERERGQHPLHRTPTPPVSPPPQSIWPCQNIKCMLLLLSKRCLRFLKALIRGRVDGNQGIFSCAKRGNNTQLIIAQQRGLDCVYDECTGQITTLHSTRRGPTQGAGQGFELSLYTNWLWDLSIGTALLGEWVDFSRLLLGHLSETFYTLKWWVSRQEVLTGLVLGEYVPSNAGRQSR